MWENICYYEDGYSEPCSFADAHLWPIADAIDRSGIATVVKDSATIVPWAGSVHLLALAVIGGLVLLVDFRALGFGVRSLPAHSLERRMRPWFWLTLLVMITSGVVLALGQVMRLYESVPYWMKMVALFSALLFTFDVRGAVLDPQRRLGGFGKAVAALAILLWVYVFSLLAAPLAWGAMAVLVAALAALYWTGKNKESHAEALPFGAKMTAMTSIALWLTVAVSGRWIAFF